MLRSRAAVLAATLRLLAERGIAGTTIEAVAETSGVAKTTIYRQWNSQGGLVLDAFDSIVQPPPDPATGSLRTDLIDLDRKSTRLNSSHANISYAVFCLKKKTPLRT